MKLFSLRMLMIAGLSLSCAQPMMAMAMEKERRQFEERTDQWNIAEKAVSQETLKWTKET